ncbi:Cell wall-associated hydrolase, NlpC family [Pedococcus dokdonensis]|uniref:Cell wall-associated hydrolase, NlpC family n=2 Tax=Pedococcus dokdonensis TaxID=443156 RepID=A0A1H0USJ4_9MICO|nr:Cell wall-associated hydrolase, NlpC family [Pedococcus dokdonensis]
MVGVLAVSMALSAAADQKPVYPSKSQVARAKTAVTTTSSEIASLDAQYVSASARLAQVQDRAAAAAEAYNGARYELDKRSAETVAAKQRAARAQDIADAAGLQVRRYAASVYQQGGNLGELDAYLSSTGPQDLMDRATALEAVSDARTQSLQKAGAASIVADTMRKQAAQAEAAQLKAAQVAQAARNAAQAQADQAKAAAAQIQQQQSALTTRLASLRKTSVKLEKQRQDGLAAAAAARAAAAEAARQAQLAAERAQAARTAAAKKAAREAAAEAARQKAAAEAAEAAAAANHPRPRPQPTEPPPPPPSTNGGVSAVLAYARAQLGKPYQWGGDGPDTFDCSGLTMRAWQRAGVNLSHYTGAQWGETARVAISDLRAGDLVFFGSSGANSHHVGLYVGGGQMIEAPYTGANVRYASIYRSDLVPYGGRP